MFTAPEAILDALQVGVLVHRGGVIAYVNAALCALVERPRGDVVGREFAQLLNPAEVERLTERFHRRMRGELVPVEYEARLALPDGRLRAVGLQVRRDGEDVVVLVRDLTDPASARARRIAVAHLGVSLQLQHTEAAVMSTLRAGLRDAAVGVLWLEPTEQGLRVDFAELPDAVLPHWQTALAARPLGDTGQWAHLTREAWGWGESFADDGLQELAGFLGASEVGALPWLEALGLVRAVAVRIDLTVGARAVLVLLAPWLAADDLPTARLLAAQVAAALDNARLMRAASIRARDLQAVNVVARRMLEAAQEGPQAVLRAACAAMRAGLHTRSVSALWRAGDDADELARVALGAEEHGGPVAARVVVADALCVREVLRGLDVVNVGDSAADPRAAGLVDESAAGQALLLVPLVARGEARGILVLADEPTRRFQDDEVALARALASVVQVGVENAELYAEARRRVEELATTQARMVQRERLAALGELAAVMAHEVRNPLAVIFNSLGTLRRRVKDDDDATMMLGILGEEAERLNRLVADLLDFARPVRLELREADAARLMEDALAATLAAQHEAQLAVSWRLDRDVPTLRCDPRRVRHALVNVLTNAVQAMGAVGPLALGVLHGASHGRPGFVGLSVRDAGPGVAAADRTRVLEPFFTTKSTGTGLGLAVVKRIVDEHEGELDLDSGPGEGATFTLWLPAVRAERGGEGAASDPVHGAPT